MPDAPAALDAAIVTDPAIRGGEPVLAGTPRRFAPLRSFGVRAWLPKKSPSTYLNLSVQQVFAALYYYMGHRHEIDAFSAANRIPETWAGKRFDPATGQVP